MALKFCDDTLKEGICLVLKPARVLPDSGRTGDESRGISIEIRVRTVKRSDGRSGVRWMEE